MKGKGFSLCRGGTLVECLMALAIIGIALAVAVEGMVVMAAQRRIIERRAAALLELDQLLERVATTPWEQLHAERIATWELSENFQSRAPQARVVADVAEESGPPSTKRVALALRWPTASGEERTPELVAWRFQPAGAVP